MTELPHRITLKTPAKINLLLHIRGKRSDGFHDIVTVMQMVDLWDEIVIERDEELHLVCSDPEIPPGRENLIYRSALILKAFAGMEKGARITLYKNIPVAAGLGGGSSDAAATLFGLNILWGLGYDNQRLSAIGREIGSDVPFFLNGPVAIGYGRGDELIPLSEHGDYWFLLINPGIQVSTAWAYGQFSPENPSNPPFFRSAQRKRCPPFSKGAGFQLPRSIATGKGGLFSSSFVSPWPMNVSSSHSDPVSYHADPDPELVSGDSGDSASKEIPDQIRNEQWIGPFSKPKFELTKEDNHIKIPLPDGFRLERDRIWLFPFNDLEEVVIKRCPIIGHIKEKMVACGAVCSLMSGSGSTVFGIFTDRGSAERAYRKLQCDGWRLWVVRALQKSPYSCNNY